jgi:hypothetical protein
LEAEGFSKRNPWKRLNSVTRAQKAEMLEASGCLFGAEKAPEKTVLVTSDKTSWLEDQSLDFGFETLKWNFPSKDGHRWAWVSPTLSLRWMMVEAAEAQEQCLRAVMEQLKDAELVFLPIFSSDHWVLLVLAMKDEKISSVRYYDSLTKASASCRKTAAQALLQLRHAEELPPRHNCATQPAGSALCGFFVLSFAEAEVRELMGEGPAVLGWPTETVETWRIRLSVVTNFLLVEAKKQLEDKKAKAAKEKTAKEKARKTIAVAERAAKAQAAVEEGAEIAGHLSKLGRKFCLEDLSEEAKKALRRITEKGNLGICSSCRFSSGCFRCELWKAERYWLAKEDPAEEREESQFLSEIDRMFEAMRKG